MSSTPTSSAEGDIKRVLDKTDLVEDSLNILNDEIEILQEAGNKGQLDPRKVKEATRRLALLKGTEPENLEMGVDSLRSEWRDMKRDLEKVKNDADASKKLTALIALREKVAACIEIARGVSR
jgi:DNA repair ATPase RecN